VIAEHRECNPHTLSHLTPQGTSTSTTVATGLLRLSMAPWSTILYLFRSLVTQPCAMGNICGPLLPMKLVAAFQRGRPSCTLSCSAMFLAKSTVLMPPYSEDQTTITLMPAFSPSSRKLSPQASTGGVGTYCAKYLKGARTHRLWGSSIPP
jgi:hypothetical protein